MGEDDVLFARAGRAGVITLNRPRALNALTLEMVRAIHPQLQAWADDDAIERVIIEAAGEKAFCAGGDIRKLYDWGLAKDPAFLAFYREEYRLNTFIKRFPKPYIALIDGIVMGGGVGLSVHGSHRIAGENITFAMPETGIGLFPDVGGTYFLPRLEGELGMYLALTGARLKAADCLHAGIATAHVPGERISELRTALIEEADPTRAIAACSTDPGAAPLEALRPAIDRCFGGTSVEDILERLEAETGEQADWAEKTAGILRTKSPTSLKITFRQIREGRRLDFEDCMRLEFRMVSAIAQGRDFFEGTRAAVIDKDNAPRWQPDDLSGVSPADVDAYFAELGEKELPLP